MKKTNGRDVELTPLRTVRKVFLSIIAIILCIVLLDFASRHASVQIVFGLEVIFFAVVAFYSKFRVKCALASKWNDLPIPLVPRFILTLAIFIALAHVLAQKTIFPFTDVGMFDEAMPPCPPGTRVYAPYMYTTMVDGKIIVHSIRRASTFWAGEYKIEDSMYSGMMYFKYRHTRKVNKKLKYFAKKSGMVGLKAKDITYTFDVDGFKLFKVEDVREFKKLPVRYLDGREYVPGN